MAIKYVQNGVPTGGSYPAKRGEAAPSLCASCHDEIRGDPVMRDGKCYCCEGCAGGGPCNC